MRTLRIVACLVVIAASAGIAYAGGDTAFTYQGRLLDAGEPANGLFDFGFGLWDAANAGNQIGSTQILNGVPVADGLFTAQIDFGADAFDNAERWLEIAVDATTLSPRQPITRAPYSIQTRGIFVDNAGKVGIGTTAPSARLSLSEQLRLFDSAPPGTASDAGYLFGPSIPSGMVTEVSGQLLDFAVNIPQTGPRDINRVGGLVRFDTRLEASRQSFNIQGWPVGSNTNFPRLFINLNTGQTNLAPGGGNVAIGNFDPIHPLEMASGAHVTSGGVWTDVSDANRKENINPVDAREILERVRDLPISTWNFKDENKSIRHLGPTAQDFHAAFALGPDDKHLASLDSGGVALAAIQGLDELVREKEKEITDLKARLAALEALVERLVLDRSGGAP